MRSKYFLVSLCLLFAISADAQNGSVSITPIYDAPASDNFCAPLTQLVNDASGDFSRAKGKEIEVHSDISIWTTNMGLPGMVTSSLLFTTSWQYEGVIYQGNSVKDMQTYYDKYKKLLEACLPAKGYYLSSEANAEPKLENYPELIYAVPAAEGKPSVPSITVKADHADNTGTYTLTLNVWQAKK